MFKNEKIEVLMEGNQSHKDHKWANEINHDTPDGVIEFKRICRICGRIEHVVQNCTMESFETVYQKFYGRSVD